MKDSSPWTLSGRKAKPKTSFSSKAPSCVIVQVVELTLDLKAFCVRQMILSALQN